MLRLAADWEFELLHRDGKLAVEQFEPFDAQRISRGREEEGFRSVELLSEGGVADAVDLELNRGLVVYTPRQSSVAALCLVLQ